MYEILIIPAREAEKKNQVSRTGFFNKIMCINIFYINASEL